MNCRPHLLLALLLAHASAAAAQGIEGLTPPRPKPPPRVDDDAGGGDQGDQDLERKRDERRRREEEAAPKPKPFVEKRREELKKEALKPRPREVLFELALVGGSAQTRGSREGYTLDPNVHFAGLWRKGGAAMDGKTGLWVGGRIAPFSGTGYQKKRPGSYGLTYFGPMIAVGKIDPVPQDDGTAKAADIGDSEPAMPSANGWLFATGLAAVSKMSRSEDKEQDDPANDFVSKGVALDGPGAWLELRYLRVLYGALGVHVLAGAQSGREKVFLYGGVGLGFWH